MVSLLLPFSIKPISLKDKNLKYFLSNLTFSKKRAEVVELHYPPIELTERPQPRITEILLENIDFTSL
jgi:hypothetical protein